MIARSAVVVFVAAFVALGSCGHARTVEGGAEEGHEHPPYDKGAAAAHQPERVPGATSTSAPSESKTGIPLATSAAQLLKPGAAKLIQERLARDGALPRSAVTGELEGATREALARYQKAHGLPATGDPDRATVEKLGLRTDDVFVSGKD